MANISRQLLEEANDKLYKLAQTSNGGSPEANELFCDSIDDDKKKSKDLKERSEKPTLKRL